MTHPLSTPIRWGIWSTGSIAGQFAADLNHVAGAARQAVCSRTQDKADEFARRHGFARGYGSEDAFLADPEIDIVYIASPHVLHKRQAIAALAAGKAVLIEKPIAMDGRRGAGDWRGRTEGRPVCDGSTVDALSSGGDQGSLCD